MSLEREFPGPNYGYVLELYDRYQKNPDSVDEATRNVFSKWKPTGQESSIQPETKLSKLIGAANLAQAIRSYGYLIAKLDPLSSHPAIDPILELESHNLSQDDLFQLSSELADLPGEHVAENASKAIEILRSIYCGTIGYDYGHIRNPGERNWLQQAAETGRFRLPKQAIDKSRLLDRLSQVEAFEVFLNRIYPGKTRFSVEGLDMLIPMLDEIIGEAARANVCVVLIGMAHRGRLNVLAHILQKPYEQILAEFKDPKDRSRTWDDLGWTGDVKYHLGGYKAPEGADHIDLVVNMPANPSHLELIDPVIQGMSRAANSKVDSPGPPKNFENASLPILIHGDASFVGQGIVAETLNFSQLPAYSTGGSLHIIANNQLGFTATEKESRSSLYASDLAKGFEIPVIHVTADEPEACVEAVHTAIAYRQKFHKDFVVDLIGYRRYGHNERDEPRFTQPSMYRKIDAHPSVRKLWASKLEKDGIIKQDEAEKSLQKYLNELQEINQKLDAERALQEPVRGACIVSLLIQTTIEEPMNYLSRMLYLLLVSFILTACGSGQLLGAPPPVPSPTPGPFLSGTPLPGDLPVISAANVGQMTQLARWGKGAINQIVRAPDGSLLAVASSLGIYLYDAATLEEIRFMDANASVSSVAFSANGKTLASGSYDNAVRLWRVSDGALLRTLEGHTDKVISVVFSPDGRTLASTSLDQTIRLWQVSDGKLLHTLKGLTYGVLSAAFSPDGQTLAWGSSDNTVRLWRVSDGTLLHILQGHKDKVISISFSLDGKTLASGSDDDTVRLWRVSDGTLLRTLEGHAGPVLSVTFSPDGQTLASGSNDNTVRLWRVSDGVLLNTLEGHAGPVLSIAFNRDGQTLTSGSKDGTVRMWRVLDGSLLSTQEGFTSAMNSVAFSPDGQILAMGSDDNTVQLRRAVDGTPFHILKGHAGPVLSVAFSPDGMMLASGSGDSTIRLWRVSDGMLLRTLDGHTEPVLSVAFSPDGLTLASGSADGTARLWRVSDGALVQTLNGYKLTGYKSLVNSVAFSPDGQTLATGLGDGSEQLWRASDGRLLRVLQGHSSWVESVAFSPDGQILASGSDDNTIWLRHGSDGSLLRTLEGHTSWVQSVAFSPDGQIVASGSDDNTIRLWQVSNGMSLRTLDGHTEPVLSVAFSPDGRTLASVSEDGTVRLWGISP